MVRVLLTIAWFISCAALLAALAAQIKARRIARRLERLTESYWELRYEHGQLRTRVNQLSPENPGTTPEAAARRPADAFIPLSSLKR
jgi:hypothetical protein